MDAYNIWEKKLTCSIGNLAITLFYFSYFIAFQFHCIAISQLSKMHRSKSWADDQASQLTDRWWWLKNIEMFSCVCCTLLLFSFIISKCCISYFSKIFQINILINLQFPEILGVGKSKAETISTFTKITHHYEWLPNPLAFS